MFYDILEKKNDLYLNESTNKPALSISVTVSLATRKDPPLTIAYKTCIQVAHQKKKKKENKKHPRVWENIV